MATWQVFLLVVAVAGTGALAPSPVTFIENLKESRSSARIVSGWEAQQGQFPHQISLRMINSVGLVASCGGSIISPEWGITAAHCPGGRVSLVIRAGLVNLTTPLYIFETTKYYNYPTYDDLSPFVQPHDIGLIEFGRSLTFSDFLKPIRLQSSSRKNRNFDGERLIASGWGITWSGGSGPENLNWVFLTGNTNLLCQLTYGSIIVDSTICASYYNVTSQSTCQGDSGGPLTIIDEDGELTMIGVTSFVSSLGCHVGMPAGFIRPGHYHKWFTEVTNIDFDWKLESTTTTEDPETDPPASTTEDAETESPSSTTEDVETEPPITTTEDPETEPPITTTEDPETEPPITTTEDPETEPPLITTEDSEA